MCRQCRRSLQNLRTQRRRADRHLEIAHRHDLELQDAEHDLAAAQQVLAEAQAAETANHQELVDRQQAWQAREAECTQLFQEYNDGKQRHLETCAPTFYDQSCEKACLDIQQSGEHGCGVIEGSEQGDAFNRGGVEAVCQPPAPSWVMRPWQAIEEASSDATEQCARITQAQPQHDHRVTSVVKAGWLMKGCTGTFAWCNWKRRYFVLESGSEVRSASLRYFRDEPAEGGDERYEKSVTMWDASSVGNGEDTERTVLRSAEACFQINHHYRGRRGSRYPSGTTYDLCVNGQDYAYASNEEVQQLRDEWVAALSAAIVHADEGGQIH